MIDPMFFVFEFIFALIGLYIYMNFLFPLMLDVLDILDNELSNPYNMIKNETFHDNIELFNDSILLNESYFTIHYRNVYIQ